MSNLGLKMVQMLVPSEKQDIKCPYTMTAEYITIHNTANNASALAEISYMVGNGNEVSYHWAVDDVQAIQAIPHNRNAWHCGDGGSGNGNRKSIGIEICYSLTPGHPKYAKAEDNGAKLAAIILHQMGWGVDRIRKHQDWSGKYCPHRILDNGNWVGFKQKVQSYLDQLKNGAQ
ncbi:TPA: N-acetylmuramoyl-L-alanine amidase, partial [Streptococcus suis]|nr:N-acetylmuramoyl-L-alanine amidase [Streptococcus suis]